MFTLGHNFAPANIHAGGLRYHGAGVIVSQLLKDNLMEAVDIQQLESFRAGCLFAQAEGIIPAPESCHAIAAAVREAEKCKETGEEKVILFNLSGHGLIDMASYDQYLAGNLMNYELKDEDIQKNLDEIKEYVIIIVLPVFRAIPCVRSKTGKALEIILCTQLIRFASRLRSLKSSRHPCKYSTPT